MFIEFDFVHELGCGWVVGGYRFVVFDASVLALIINLDNVFVVWLSDTAIFFWG